MANETRALHRMALDIAPKQDRAMVAPSHVAAFDENSVTAAACAMVVFLRDLRDRQRIKIHDVDRRCR